MHTCECVCRCVRVSARKGLCIPPLIITEAQEGSGRVGRVGKQTLDRIPTEC